MIYTYIICTALLILSFVCSKQNIFSPGFLASGIWFVCLALFVILPHQLPPLSKQFISALTIWLIFFTVSSLFMQSFAYKTTNIQPNTIIKDLYFWLSIASIPLLVSFAYTAIKTGTSGNWAWDLRSAAIGKDTDEAYTPFYFLIWTATYLLYLINITKKNWKRVVILGLLVLGFGIISMSKTLILNFFVLTVFILYIKKYITTRHILIGIAALFVLLIGIQSIRHAVKIDASETENTLVLYILSSMSAFDTLTPLSSAHWGENTLRIIYAIPYKLGFSDIQPVNPILPWIYKPIATNTYTCMYPFFKDFGYWGISIFAIILGTFYGWVFKRFQQGDIFFTLFFAYCCTLIVTQYNGDAFFTNLAGHTKFALLLYIPFFASKHHLFEKK